MVCWSPTIVGCFASDVAVKGVWEKIIPLALGDVEMMSEMGTLQGNVVEVSVAVFSVPDPGIDMDVKGIGEIQEIRFFSSFFSLACIALFLGFVFALIISFLKTK